MQTDEYAVQCNDKVTRIEEKPYVLRNHIQYERE